MIQQTPSNKHEPCFPDTYKEILEARPSSKPYYGDECCDAVCCIGFSPVILPMWVFCCLGVTAKKTKNACFNSSVSTKVNDSITVISEQPKKELNTNKYINCK